MAFRLVFAARKFVAAHQTSHAMRCYRYAQHIYAGHEWSMIDDHIRYALGRQLSANDRDVDALQVFNELLANIAVTSKERQASYVR